MTYQPRFNPENVEADKFCLRDAIKFTVVGIIVLTYCFGYTVMKGALHSHGAFVESPN